MKRSIGAKTRTRTGAGIVSVGGEIMMMMSKEGFLDYWKTGETEGDGEGGVLLWSWLLRRWMRK
jgi:hypothetical protein